ncbi:MAG: helix-turn-helix transcriptional regulator [Oscillospiraceae bacterium]|nr:helix-turn-helix transcriptional regulator [Oscillospiraceae bacterium]
MDYCKNLRDLRIANGYTQEQIAFILHTRQEQYSKYENGKRELPIRHLITLCCLYRVSADRVLGIEKFVS